MATPHRLRHHAVGFVGEALRRPPSHALGQSTFGYISSWIDCTRDQLAAVAATLCWRGLMPRTRLKAALSAKGLP